MFEFFSAIINLELRKLAVIGGVVLALFSVTWFTVHTLTEPGQNVEIFGIGYTKKVTTPRIPTPIAKAAPTPTPTMPEIPTAISGDVLTPTPTMLSTPATIRGDVPTPKPTMAPPTEPACTEPGGYLIQFRKFVGDGAPCPGAGNIEEPGAEDVYTMRVDAKQTVSFDVIFPTCAEPNITGNLRWGIKHESGASFDGWQTWLSSCSTQNKNIPLEVGEYTVTVSGERAATGTYSFQFWRVPAVENFDIGDGKIIVSKDKPRSGAGNIEEPGAEDVYTMRVDAKQTVSFDVIFPTCAEPNITGNLRWGIKHESGASFDGWQTWLSSCSTQNKNIPLEVGEYTVTVSGERAATGTYSFQIN